MPRLARGLGLPPRGSLSQDTAHKGSDQVIGHCLRYVAELFLRCRRSFKDIRIP